MIVLDGLLVHNAGNFTGRIAEFACEILYNRLTEYKVEIIARVESPAHRNGVMHIKPGLIFFVIFLRALLISTFVLDDESFIPFADQCGE